MTQVTSLPLAVPAPLVQPQGVDPDAALDGPDFAAVLNVMPMGDSAIGMLKATGRQAEGMALVPFQPTLPDKGPPPAFRQAKAEGASGMEIAESPLMEAVAAPFPALPQMAETGKKADPPTDRGADLVPFAIVPPPMQQDQLADDAGGVPLGPEGSDLAAEVFGSAPAAGAVSMGPKVEPPGAVKTAPMPPSGARAEALPLRLEAAPEGPGSKPPQLLPEPALSAALQASAPVRMSSQGGKNVTDKAENAKLPNQTSPVAAPAVPRTGVTVPEESLPPDRAAEKPVAEGRPAPHDPPKITAALPANDQPLGPLPSGAVSASPASAPAIPAKGPTLEAARPGLPDPALGLVILPSRPRLVPEEKAATPVVMRLPDPAEAKAAHAKAQPGTLPEAEAPAPTPPNAAVSRDEIRIRTFWADPASAPQPTPQAQPASPTEARAPGPAIPSLPAQSGLTTPMAPAPLETPPAPAHGPERMTRPVRGGEAVPSTLPPALPTDAAPGKTDQHVSPPAAVSPPDLPPARLASAPVGPAPEGSADVPAPHVQIARAVAVFAGPVTEVRLSPEELGPVRIDMRTEGDRLLVTVTAERPETLDLLRRHSDQLAADLRAAGHQGLDLGFGRWSGEGGEGRAAPQALPAQADPTQGSSPADAKPAGQPPSKGSPPLSPTGLYLRI